MRAEPVSYYDIAGRVQSYVAAWVRFRTATVAVVSRTDCKNSATSLPTLTSPSARFRAIRGNSSDPAGGSTVDDKPFEAKCEPLG
jgi:hypothetical protein